MHWPYVFFIYVGSYRCIRSQNTKSSETIMDLLHENMFMKSWVFNQSSRNSTVLRTMTINDKTYYHRHMNICKRSKALSANHRNNSDHRYWLCKGLVRVYLHEKTKLCLCYYCTLLVLFPSTIRTFHLFVIKL